MPFPAVSKVNQIGSVYNCKHQTGGANNAASQRATVHEWPQIPNATVSDPLKRLKPVKIKGSGVTPLYLESEVRRGDSSDRPRGNGPTPRVTGSRAHEHCDNRSKHRRPGCFRARNGDGGWPGFKFKMIFCFDDSHHCTDPAEVRVRAAPATFGARCRTKIVPRTRRPAGQLDLTGMLGMSSFRGGHRLVLRDSELSGRGGSAADSDARQSRVTHQA